MPHSQSHALPLGATAPAFELPEVTSGEMLTLDRFAGSSALLVMFICRHCPYVQHIQKELVRLARDYAGQPLGIVAISSNDPEAYPEDALSKLWNRPPESSWLGDLKLEYAEKFKAA